MSGKFSLVFSGRSREVGDKVLHPSKVLELSLVTRSEMLQQSVRNARETLEQHLPELLKTMVDLAGVCGVQMALIIIIGDGEPIRFTSTGFDGLMKEYLAEYDHGNLNGPGDAGSNFQSDEQRETLEARFPGFYEDCMALWRDRMVELALVVFRNPIPIHFASKNFVAFMDKALTGRGGGASEFGDRSALASTDSLR